MDKIDQIANPERFKEIKNRILNTRLNLKDKVLLTEILNWMAILCETGIAPATVLNAYVRLHVNVPEIEES